MKIDNSDDRLELDDNDFNDVFDSDESKEAEGEWMPVPGKKGWRVLVRSQWSPKWRNFANKQQRRHTSLLQAKKDVPAEEQDADAIEQLAKVGIIEWEGFNGVTCTPDNIRKLLRRYPAFRTYIMTWCADRSNFRAASLKAVEGN